MGNLPGAVARGPNDLQQIAASLAGFVPGLNTAFGSYMEGVRQQEGAEARSDTGRAPSGCPELGLGSGAGPHLS